MTFRIHISGTRDPLISRLIDGYRHRNFEPTTVKISAQIRRMASDGGGDTAQPIMKKKNKKLPNVYLVNKNKFHCVVSDEELRQEITDDNLDERAHQILQHKIR